MNYDEMEAELARVTAELDELRKACAPFVKEARFIVECQLPDTYQSGKIPVKQWRALAAAFPTEHVHEWKSARNEVVISGEMCGCGTIRADQVGR